jgi:hypothetical protein
MRVTSPPAALSIAAALAALLLLAHPSSAGAERWQRPVPGEVTRSFDYSPAAPFARGAHRGADLGAPPGATVRAACDGRVVHAGPVPGGAAAVTLRCGSRRVTHLPLRSTAVGRGVRVRAGAHLGALAGGHAGLHLGVRAADDPFAYENPLALLPPPGEVAPGPPILAPVRPASPRWRPRPAQPRLRPTRPRPTPRPSPPIPRAAHPPAAARAPSLAGADRPSAAGTDRPLAPPLAWAGLGLAALGAAGTGAVTRARRRRPACAHGAAPPPIADPARAQSNA